MKIHNHMLKLVIAVVIGFSWSAMAAKPVYTAFLSNIALKGYDPVAYFSDGRPVKGDKKFEVKYQGASWWFATAENRDRFQENPEAFAPAYGGYCAWAMANNKEAPGNPAFWKIIEGRLYLNYSRDIQEKWEQDIPGFINKADQHWPARRRQ